MGNTPSHQQQNTNIYSSYIQQQQDLIYKQQQINELYKFNLQSQQQMPSNMFFQSDVQHNQHNQQQQLPSQNIPQLPSVKPKYKLDPYKILNISKEYDEITLKKAYLKAAMKTHPDRGGSATAFQQVSIAYTLLTKNRPSILS